jgi:hypothetical protein
MTAMHQWRRDHPGESLRPAEATDIGAPTEKPTEPGAAPAEPGAAEPGKPAEGAEPGAPAAEAAPATPRQLADLMEKTPEFGAFMEAHPEVKGPVFALARKLAEAEPILAIAPTLGDAQFLQEYAGNQVALKTASLRTIDNPESVPEFLNLFDQQFQRLDAEGKPVVDAQGQPVLDADHQAVVGGLVNREIGKYSTQIKGEMQQLEAKLAGYYPNEASKAMDGKRLENLKLADLALQVLEQIRDGSIFDAAAPELPEDATEEQKTWFTEQRAELARQRQAIEDQKKGAGKEERAAQAAAFNTSVRNDLGMTAGKMIGEALKQVEDSGVYIPEMYKQEKYRDRSGKEWNTPRIAAELFIQFENELMKPGSKTLMEITQHQLLPANGQTRKIRQDYYARKAADMIPQLVDKEVGRIQDLVKVDQDKLGARAAARNQAASAEPSTGGSSLPQNASREQILQAAEEAAKKLPEWAAANPNDRQAMMLTQFHRLRKK